MTCPSNHQHEQATHIGDVGVVFLVRRKRIWQQSWEGPALGNITSFAGGKISWSDRNANPHLRIGNPKRLPIVNEGAAKLPAGFDIHKYWRWLRGLRRDCERLNVTKESTELSPSLARRDFKEMWEKFFWSRFPVQVSRLSSINYARLEFWTLFLTEQWDSIMIWSGFNP